MLEILSSTLPDTLFVLVYASIFIYAPAKILVRPLPLKPFQTETVSLVLGFSLYSFLVYTARHFHLPFATTELLILCFLFANRHLLKNLVPKPSLNTPLAIALLFVLTTSLLHAAVLIRSGIDTDQGIVFTNLAFHDSTQHLTIIDRLYTQTQIVHPGFSGAKLINYHYLIDVSLAAITRFPLVSLFNVYYRIYPLTISLIFLFCLYTLTRTITKSRLAGLSASLFTVFAGNAAYAVAPFRDAAFKPAANNFMINPILDLLQNPASIFVLAQFVVVLLLIKLTPNKINKHFLITVSFIAGTMIGFKAWGGIIIATGLFFAACSDLITNKRPQLLITWIISMAIAAFLFLPGYDPHTSASPIWAPGWTLERMINDADRWNYLQDLFLLQHYQHANNLPRLILVYTKLTLIYTLGNLWLRTIGFFGLLIFLLRSKKITPFKLALVTSTIISFSFPLLFNQGRMAYDIEQFAPYSLVTLSVFTVISIHYLLKQHNSTIQVVTFAFLIFLAFPSNIHSLWPRMTGETTTISHDQFATYDQVRNHTTIDDTILLSPSHRNRATLRFAAFTGRNTFFSGRTLGLISGYPVEERYMEIRNFFESKNPSEQAKFVRENHLTHLYLYDEDRRDFTPDPSYSRLIFETGSGLLYQLNFQ